MRPDSRFLFLPIVLVSLLSAAPARAVSRQDAATTVINTVILPHPNVQTILGYGPQSSVAAGVTIFDGFDSSPLVTVPSESWLFWINPHPETRFGHPTEFVLVDVLTGSVTAHVSGSFWPRFGGVDYYRSSDDRSAVGLDVIFVGVNANNSPQALPQNILPVPPRSPAPSKLAAAKCALIIVGETTVGNPDFQADRDSAKAILGLLGVPAGDIQVVENQNKTNVCNAIDGLDKDCPKLYVFVISHGLRGKFFSRSEAITAEELAHKLKGRMAQEYCAVLAQCYSGSFLPALRDSGIRGFHVTSASPETTAHARNYLAVKFPWMGEVYLHYLTGCIRAGLRGQAAHKCAQDSVTAYVDRRVKMGAAPHNPMPESSQIFADTTSGQSTTIVAPAGTGTICVSWKAGPANVCGNATLYCEVVNGMDTTWKIVKIWNWNLGETRYFAPFGAPGATGRYKLVSHSNGYPVCGEIRFLDNVLPETPTSAIIYPALSVGWVDGSHAEFELTPPPVTFGYMPGAPLQAVPAHIGVEQPFPARYFFLSYNVQPDPLRPWLYNNNDPVFGFNGTTQLQIFSDGIFDPFGNPAPALPLLVEFFQGPTYRPFNVFAQNTAGGIVVPPINLGPLAVQPFQVRVSVQGTQLAAGPGSGYLSLDALAIDHSTAGPVDVPPSGLPTRLELTNGRPNPFHESTVFTFALPERRMVRARIFDLAGRQVRTLANGPMESGMHPLTWDGRTDDGRDLGAGVYFAVVETGDRRLTSRVVRVR